MYLLWQVNKLNWTKTLSYASQRCTSWRALQLPTRFKRYISWTKITQHFQESKMKVTQRSEGERLISYTKTSRKEKRKRVGLVGGGMLDTTRYTRHWPISMIRLWIGRERGKWKSNSWRDEEKTNREVKWNKTKKQWTMKKALMVQHPKKQSIERKASEQAEKKLKE